MSDGRQMTDGRHGMPTHGRQMPCLIMLGLGALAAAAEPAPVPQLPSATPQAATRQADPVERSRITADSAQADLGTAIDDARFLLAAGRAREAANRLTEALAVDTRHDPALRGQAAALLATAATTEQTDDRGSSEAARRDSAASARAASAHEADSRANQRSERLARIADLRSRGLRELALANCRSLLSDLPGDEEVDAIFRDLLAEAHDVRRTTTIEREQELRAEVALMVERSLIPEGFDGQPMFPSDWSQRRSGRSSPFEVHDKAPAWMEQVSDHLAERTTVTFDATPVAEAIDLVSRLGGINIVASPELLAATDKNITLRAAGMRLEHILTWICEQADTRWSIVNGGVYVGEQTETQRYTAIHDIGELLVGNSDFPGPQLAMNSSTSDSGAGFLTGTEDTAPTPTADDVADLIRRSVSPRTWEDDANGIVVRGNALFVTAPDGAQRLIREFLRAQSAQRSLSVRIETRWLELTDGYVEEIGVEWTSGSGTLIDPGTGSTSGLVRRSNGWEINGATSSTLPATSMSLNPGTSGTGLTLQTALLGNTGLSAVLHAVERSAQARVLQAPELVCLNGQRAHAFFGNQVAYIADYEVVSSQYDPVIEIVNIGASIDIRPLASADRKYVTLELRSAIASATLFTDYITTADPDRNNGLDTNGDGIIDVYLGTPISYPIELPNITVRALGTTVMMPDRGSMLIGGFGRSLDEFSATRVPLLGSIPFLGRLFGARGRYAQRSNLYLLTTATIINYPELEARL